MQSRAVLPSPTRSLSDLFNRIGHVWTLFKLNGASLLPPKAEIGQRKHDVRDVPLSTPPPSNFPTSA
jgi:hypothetical protein